MSTLATHRASLSAVIDAVRADGRSRAARCPAHDDRHPSLSVTLGDDDRVLLKCHGSSACTFDAICTAAGINPATLGPRSGSAGNGQWLEQRWEIRDQHGALVAIHHRCDGPDGKRVWWSSPADPKSLDGLRTADLPLYGVERLGDAREVVITEGEKAADAVIAGGIAAVGTVTGASGTPGDAALRPLVGRRAVLWADYYDPDDGSDAARGAREHMQRIAARLRALGCKDVLFVSWGRDPGDDAADAAQRSEDLCAIVASAVAAPDGISIVASTDGSTVTTAAYIPPPVECLPEPVRRYIVQGAAAIGCDSAMVLLPVLSMLGAAIGLSRRIRLKRVWNAPPTIWAVVIGESGTMKSPAQDYGLAPLSQIQHEAMAEYHDDLESFDEALAMWEARKKSERGPAPKPPVARRYIVSDTTTEALAPILEANPRGVLIAVDELAAWLGGFDRYNAGGRGADRARWLSLHRAGELLIDRRTRPLIHIPCATACVVGGIQPGIAKRILSGEAEESGLLARLLVAAPPRRPKKWTDADISETGEMLTLVRGLTLLKPADADMLTVDLPLSTEAHSAWVEWYDRHAQRLTDAEGSFAQALSKLEEYAARFALIHSLASVEDPSAVRSVGREAIEAGCQLANWFSSEAERVYRLLRETPDQKNLRQLSEWLAGRDWVASRDVVAGIRRYRGSGGAQRADRDLRELVTAGLVETRERTSRRGPPSTQYRWRQHVSSQQVSRKTEETTGPVDACESEASESEMTEWTG